MNIDEFRQKLDEIICKPREEHEKMIAQLYSQYPHKIKIRERAIGGYNTPETMHTWAYICFMYALDIMHPNPKKIRNDSGLCIPEKYFVEDCISNNLLEEISQKEAKNGDIIIYFTWHDFNLLGDKIDVILFESEYKNNYKLINDVLLSFRKGYAEATGEMYKLAFWGIFRIPNLNQLLASNEGAVAAQKATDDSGIKFMNTQILSEICPHTFRKLPAHAGKIDNDKVISKWGAKGHLWEHGILEVPLSYGGPKYYKRKNGINFKNKFVEYIKLKGCSEDVIQYWSVEYVNMGRRYDSAIIRKSVRKLCQA